VRSLKIDSQTLNVYGTVDEDGDDPVNYDSVVIASDVGSLQYMLNNTINNYLRDNNIRPVLDRINTTSIGLMKLAPDYKVS
jgi:hypothetical protein